MAVDRLRQLQPNNRLPWSTTTLHLTKGPSIAIIGCNCIQWSRSRKLASGGVETSQPIYKVEGLNDVTFNHSTSSRAFDLAYFVQCKKRVKWSWKIGDKVKPLIIMDWIFAVLRFGYYYVHD